MLTVQKSYSSTLQQPSGIDAPYHWKVYCGSLLSGSRWLFQRCLSFAVWGGHNASLFLLKPETTKKNTTHSSSPTKALSYLQRTSKFNNLQFNCCNCLFLITGHYCALCRFTNYRQHNVHWTELQCESLTSRALLQVKPSLQNILTCL